MLGFHQKLAVPARHQQPFDMKRVRQSADRRNKASAELPIDALNTRRAFLTLGRSSVRRSFWPVRYK